MSVKYGECHPKLWQIKKMPKRHQKEYFSILFVLGFTVETICNAIEAAPAQIKHLFRELDFRPEALSDHHKRYVQSVLDKIRDMSENHRLVISFEHIYDALEMVNFRDSHSFYQIMMATAKEEVGRLERRKAKRNQAEKAQNASTEATVQPIECGEDSRMITMEDIVGSIRNLTDDEILKLAENCPLYAIDWAQFMAKPDTAEGDRSNRDNTKKGYLENVMLFWRPTTGMIAKYLFCDMVTSGAIRHYVEKFYLQYEPINVRSNEYKGVNEAFKLWAELKRWHTFTGTPQAETLGETEVSTVQPVDETEATEGEVETEAPSVVPTINDIVHKTDDELETEGLTDEEAQTSVEKCPVQPVGVEEFRSWPFEKRFGYMLTLRNYWGISFVAICQILFKDKISPSKYYSYVAEHRIPSKPGRYTASRAVVLAFGIWCEIVAGDGTRPNDVTNSSQPEEPSNSSGENDEVANEPSTPPRAIRRRIVPRKRRRKAAPRKFRRSRTAKRLCFRTARLCSIRTLSRPRTTIRRDLNRKPIPRRNRSNSYRRWMSQKRCSARLMAFIP